MTSLYRRPRNIRTSGKRLWTPRSLGPDLVLWLNAGMGATVIEPSYVDPSAFEQASWIKSGCTVTANATPNPFGTGLACKIVEDAAGGGKSVRQAPSNVLVGAINSTVTVYAKAAGRDWLAMAPQNAFVVVYFDLANGVVGSTAGANYLSSSITSAGNGWYRCSVTYANEDGTPTYLHVAQADGVVVYAGDGVSGIYLYEADIDQPYYSLAALADQSGYGNDFTQPVFANMSLWQESDPVMNGRPSVRPYLGGVKLNSWLSYAGASVEAAPWSIFAARSQDGVVGNQYIWSRPVGAGRSDLYLSPGIMEEHYLGSDGTVDIFTPATPVKAVVGATQEANPALSNVLYQNAITAVASALSGAVYPSMFAANRTVGAYGGFSNPLQGTYTEIIGVRGVPTASQRTNIMRWLGSAYGIVIGP